jgi:hypothetical protein
MTPPREGLLQRFPSLDAWLAVAGLIVIMFVAMWVDRAPITCALRPETARPLDLTRTLDREHLARERAEVDRVSRRIAGPPTASTGERMQFDRCEAALLQELSVRHSLSPDDLR